MGWETWTSLVPCGLPVFILKLFECKQVEWSVYFIATFDKF